MVVQGEKKFHHRIDVSQGSKYASGLNLKNFSIHFTLTSRTKMLLKKLWSMHTDDKISKYQQKKC